MSQVMVGCTSLRPQPLPRTSSSMIYSPMAHCLLSPPRVSIAVDWARTPAFPLFAIQPYCAIDVNGHAYCSNIVLVYWIMLSESLKTHLACSRFQFTMLFSKTSCRAAVFLVFYGVMYVQLSLCHILCFAKWMEEHSAAFIVTFLVFCTLRW